ncbi:MAG: protein-export chaperone SecB [Micavibrio sp.]|nr:protein-export chaperone SecB [Micavibrio sp.]
MTNKKQDNNTEETEGNVPNSPVVIHAQYTKDLSFENPHAPQSFRGQGNPEMDMNIELEVQKIEDPDNDSLFEVVIKVNATAKRTDQTLFLVELSYAALVTLNVEEKMQHPMLFVEVPHTIFPYARQIIADSTQSGGYIPLLLNPVDFKTMYLQRFGEQMEKNAKQA